MSNIMYDVVLCSVLLVLPKFIFTSVYNRVFHPLRKFPGPTHRAAWSLPYIWETWKGDSVKNTQLLHEEYGPVVRIAPDALSFTSAQAWKDIYGFRQNKQQIPKDYKRFPDAPDPLPILASNDTDHARIRKLTAHAFTDIALKEQWPLISHHLLTFISKVEAVAAQSPDGKVDLNKWFNALTFDVVTELSFGEPLGALHSDGRSAYIDDFFTSCRIFPLIPTSWEYPIVKNCLKLMMMIPSVKRIQEMGYLSTKAKVQKRIAAADTTKKMDFMAYILRAIDETGMTEPEIVGSTAVFVNAGGESTGVCISAAMYYLISNPEALKRAREEVLSAFRSAEEVTQQAVNLPYLNAVVEEALRIHPPTPGIFARRTGDRLELIDGHLVPPHTSVGVHVWAAHHSKANFHSPDKFVPERWLPDPPAEYQGDVKAASQPWSLGPRNCMGKRLAYMEIRTTIAMMLWYFAFSLCDESSNWVAEQSYNIVWNRGPLYVSLRKRHGVD